jgi:hypothetical protein
MQHPNLGGDNNAVNQATQRLSVDPKDPRAYKMRAEAYIRQGKTEQARSDLMAAIMYSPTDPDLFADLASVEKDNPNAVKMYREKAQQLRMSGYTGGTASRLADPGVLWVLGGMLFIVILLMFIMPRSNREAYWDGSSNPSGGVFPD